VRTWLVACGLILEYNSLSIDASILKEFSLFFNEV
jgi:hypothetical protein